MNHHFRSYSEQPAQSNNNNLINRNGINNGICDTNTNNFLSNRNPESLIQQGQTTSTIMEHSDSQQSLDRLFNPQNNPQRPLRERDLPASFFNPNLSANQSFHHRSTSYNPTSSNLQQSRTLPIGQQPQPRVMTDNNNAGFHHRTQSTVTPMTTYSDTNSSSTNNGNQPTNTNGILHEHRHEQNQDVNRSGNQQIATGDRINSDSNTMNNNSTNGTEHIAPIAPNQRQADQSSTVTTNYHHRVFSSPLFSRPNITNQHRQPVSQPNQYQQVTLSNNQQSTPFYGTSSQNQAPVTSGNADYYQFASNPDLSQPGPVISQPVIATPIVNPYFASSDALQPTSISSNSQPYVSYDSALGQSSMSMLNQASCQTVSSSSSSSTTEASHAMLIMPSPAVHSRSCSFDDNASAQPVPHIRTQSSIAGLSHSMNQPARVMYDQYHRDHQLPLSTMTPDGGLAGIKNEMPTINIPNSTPLSPNNPSYTALSEPTFNDWANNSID